MRLFLVACEIRSLSVVSDRALAPVTWGRFCSSSLHDCRLKRGTEQWWPSGYGVYKGVKGGGLIPLSLDLIFTFAVN